MPVNSTAILPAFLTMDLAVPITAVVVIAGLAFTTFMVLLALGPHLPASIARSFGDVPGEGTPTLEADPQESD